VSTSATCMYIRVALPNFMTNFERNTLMMTSNSSGSGEKAGSEPSQLGTRVGSHSVITQYSALVSNINVLLTPSCSSHYESPEYVLTSTR
jgi:hypothetical protein